MAPPLSLFSSLSPIAPNAGRSKSVPPVVANVSRVPPSSSLIELALNLTLRTETSLPIPLSSANDTALKRVNFSLASRNEYIEEKMLVFFTSSVVDKKPTFALCVWFCTETTTSVLDATAMTSRKYDNCDCNS